MKKKAWKSVSAVFMAMCMAITMSSTSLFMVVADALETKQESSVKSVENDSTSENTLKNIVFYSDNKGNHEVEITPKFDSSVKEYEVYLPQSAECYAKITPNNSADQILVGSSWNPTNPTEPAEADTYQRIFLESNGDTPIQIKVGGTVYKFKITKIASLNNLSINDTLTPKFDRNYVDEYDAYVPVEGKIDITAQSWNNEYTVTLNGEKTTGNITSIEPKWDSNGKMKVKIEVSHDGYKSHTYTLTLHKQPEGKPMILTQPSDATYFTTNSGGNEIKIVATADGNLSYQWYENTTNSTDGGTPIAGETGKTYTPMFFDIDMGEAKVKHLYYYCVVTNTKEDGSTFSETSRVADIAIHDVPQLKIVTEDGQELSNLYEVKVGDTLKVKVVNEKDLDGTIEKYTWSNGLGDTTDPIYELKFSKDGSYRYNCTARYTIDGKSCNVSTGNSVRVKAVADKAAKPEIKTQPEDGVYLIGEIPDELKTVATSPDGGKITYQWQSSTSGKYFYNEDKATKQNYTPPTSSSVKDIYYRCRITNNLTSLTGDEYATSGYTRTAKIQFKSLDYFTQQLDADCFEGEGTVENPYKIKNLKDLELLRDLVNKKGVSLSNMYFQLEADITLPEGWVSIGTLKEGATAEGRGKYMIPFGGILDGNNHTITAAKGGLPLFKYVRNAVIKNLNIAGEYIAEDGLISNYVVDYGKDGRYGLGDPETVEIDNVTIKSGTTIKGSGFLGGYASGVNVVRINNCTVESGVKIGWDADKNESAGQSKIGSLAGDFNGIVTNCTSAATVYGNDKVGGLVAAKGQSMGLCGIYDSSFTGTVQATGNYVGGILGAGYISGSAPNTPCVSLMNNSNTGTITGGNYVGGIFGGEGYDKQCWPNGIGYIHANYSSGELKATSGSNIGGVIGYMYALNRYNVISDNYYVEDTADKGIGLIENVDTTSESYGRSDDPKGKDADKLTKSISRADLTNENLVKLLNEAKNSSKNWIQGDSTPIKTKDKHIVYINATVEGNSLGLARIKGGEELPIDKITVKATYSDNTVVKLNNKDIKFVGFDSSKKGYIMVEVNYEGKTCYIAFNIASDAPENEVKITFDADNGSNNVVKKVEKDQTLNYTPEVPTKDGYTFVGWYKDTDDITTKYESGAAYTENTTYKAKYAHVSMLGAQGKSVVNGNSGIRFGTKLYNDGDEIVEKGTLILPANLLGEGEALTLENTKAAKSVAKVNYETNEDKNYIVYLGTIVGISESQFDRQMTASSYVTYKDKAGNEYTVYAPYQKGSTSVNQLLGFQ